MIVTYQKGVMATGTWGWVTNQKKEEKITN